MRLAFGSVVTAELASFVGLPAAGPGGYPWQYCRAGLEYSLSSELKLNAERVSGYQYTANLISVLDPRKKHGAERQPIPPLAYFERNLNGSERNPADRIALAHVASLIHGADGPVQLPDAIALYMEKRHAFLTMVKEHHYILMKVPSYVSELEAVEVASEGSEDEDEGDAADERWRARRCLQRCSSWWRTLRATRMPQPMPFSRRRPFGAAVTAGRGRRHGSAAAATCGRTARANGAHAVPTAPTRSARLALWRRSRQRARRGRARAGTACS
jgi:hypothetical protein